jgi:hypothetical protein
MLHRVPEEDVEEASDLVGMEGASRTAELTTRVGMAILDVVADMMTGVSVGLAGMIGVVSLAA